MTQANVTIPSILLDTYTHLNVHLNAHKKLIRNILDLLQNDLNQKGQFSVESNAHY